VAMHGRGNIIAISGPKGAGWADPKLFALQDLLVSAKDMHIVATQYTDGSRAQTIQVMENLSLAHPDFQAVWTPYVDQAIGVVQVLKNNGIPSGKVVVVSNGWTPDTLDAMNQGWVYGTSLQQGVLSGQQSVRMCVDLLNGGKPPFHILEPLIPLTKDNVNSVSFDTSQAPNGFKPTGRINAGG